MKIVKLNGVKIEPNTVAAIGFFDGVHKAHKVLLETTVNIGKQKNMKTAVITFDVHPKSVLFGLDYHYITPLEEKIVRIKEYEIDTLYLLEFTKEKASLKPEDFIARYLGNLHTLVCGFDFKFGVRGSGNVQTLKNCELFDTVVVNEITQDGYKVGSSHIRDLIQSGQVELIPTVMGRFYSIRGEVIHGDRNGRLLGYPTANISSNQYLIPKTGVYVTKTFVRNKWYQSVTSVGHNPTLNCRIDVSIETYIFDFDQKIYGETITIQFMQRLRDELKFMTVDELVKQIDKDVKQVQEYFQ